MSNTSPLLTVENLSVHFGPQDAPVKAVDGVSFDMQRGETVALVGESGCGKSMTALSLARLLPQAARITSGRIVLDKRDVFALSEEGLRDLRGNEAAYIFQEPGTSLNPVFTVGWQIAEAVKLHTDRNDIQAAVEESLRLVGIPSPREAAGAYPHQLSGGMQQRVMIAMALACRPRLLIADEPTTALDVTIQAQILELLQKIQQELDMAVLLITHNLGLVADVASRVNVMYAGRIVESGPVRDVLYRPAHPYTEGLLRAVPRLTSTAGELEGIAGTVPDLSSLPSGCVFHPRCPYAQEKCRGSEPELEALSSGERRVRCYYPRVNGETSS